MTSQPQHETAQLPVPLAPELLLAVHPDKGPIIVDIARLASWTGHAVAELVGQPLEQVFHEVMPGLPVVVEEVLRSGMPVHDYRLTYTDHDGVNAPRSCRQGRVPARQGSRTVWSGCVWRNYHSGLAAQGTSSPALAGSWVRHQLSSVCCIKSSSMGRQTRRY